MQCDGVPRYVLDLQPWRGQTAGNGGSRPRLHAYMQSGSSYSVGHTTYGVLLTAQPFVADDMVSDAT